MASAATRKTGTASPRRSPRARPSTPSTCCAPVQADGTAGALQLVAGRLRVDDLAYDRQGRLYLCTHLGHSLDRLDREGDRISLGGPDQGLAGSTACAFGSGGALFVTTTGGILAPPGRALQPARLVRLDVSAEGHPLDHPWEA